MPGQCVPGNKKTNQATNRALQSIVRLCPVTHSDVDPSSKAIANIMKRQCQNECNEHPSNQLYEIVPFGDDSLLFGPETLGDQKAFVHCFIEYCTFAKSTANALV